MRGISDNRRRASTGDDPADPDTGTGAGAGTGDPAPAKGNSMTTSGSSSSTTAAATKVVAIKSSTATLTAASASSTNGDNGSGVAASQNVRFLATDYSELNGTRAIQAASVERTITWTYLDGVVTNNFQLWVAPNGVLQTDISDKWDYLSPAIIATYNNHNLNGTNLDLSRFITGSGNLDQYAGQDMLFQISWTDANGNQGTTSSGLFTIANPGNQLNKAQDHLQSEIAADPALNTGAEKTAAASTTAATGSVQTGSGGGQNVGSGGIGGAAPPSSSTSTTSSHHKSGLSTGAIAGIAVAAVIVGLALIAGLIFFALRRRRSRKSGLQRGEYSAQQSENNFGSSSGAAAVASEKSTHSRVVETQTQPLQHQQEIPLDDGTVHDREVEDDFQHPYHDTPLRTSDGHEVDSIGDQVETSSGGPTRNVAHLMEEGMTEDDVRRLEREERELDEEIERAGRR